MEIERKFLVKILPENLKDYPVRLLEQGYLCTSPVVRIRRDNDTYELTYKSKGLMVREEYNLPLTEEAYAHLKEKVDGRIIRKKRYLIPHGSYTIELDIFEGDLKPLILAEVEFPTVIEANTFKAPDWLGEDVTGQTMYYNSALSKLKTQTPEA